MDINEYIPNGYKSWTEYYESRKNRPNWGAGLLAAVILILAWSINAAIDMSIIL